MDYVRPHENGSFDIREPIEYVMFASVKHGGWTKALKPTTMSTMAVKVALTMFPLAFPDDKIFVRVLNLN